MFVTLLNKVEHRLCNTPSLLCCVIKVISDTDKPARSQMGCRCLIIAGELDLMAFKGPYQDK